MLATRHDIASTLPGCLATGATREQTIERMRTAIALHLDGMRADGEPIPEPIKVGVGDPIQTIALVLRAVSSTP
ncbi:MAG: type II toxin-antitoxin system HicB family antitoxin [Conexibacter sp.]